ncbi:MAG: hypothetical protein NTZ50_11470 [Chloroflexi bacterium]|nr:hypothetical protein [Chloroflexota bacterium]
MVRTLLCLLFVASLLTPAHAQDGGHKIFVPALMRENPLRNVFGVESNNLVATSAAIKDLGATWVRKNGLLWSKVEPTQGVRDWGAVAALESELRAAHSAGFQVILIVRSAPAWAQQIDGKSCGPIKAAALPAFAAFIHDAVQRYSTSDYNVLHWEIWNEPDVDASISSGSEPYGCYGDQNDVYFGGAAYANMLSAVYPQVKSAHPAAKVVFGGLLLDCPPENLRVPSTNCSPQRRNSAKFLEGVLQAGGAAWFDIANVHSYDYFGAPGRYNDLNWGNTESDGPLLLRKIAFMHEVLGRYGAADKPIMNTETAVICYGCRNLQKLEDTKLANAYYLVQSFAAAKAVDLLANVHYSYEGWNGSGLASGGTKFVSYGAYALAAEKLGSARYVAPITPSDVGGAVDVGGYKFTRNGKVLWVLWSTSGVTRTLTLTGSPTFTGALGGNLSGTVGYEPVYVEWP